jgi:hypothetical protein
MECNPPVAPLMEHRDSVSHDHSTRMSEGYIYTRFLSQERTSLLSSNTSQPHYEDYFHFGCTILLSLDGHCRAIRLAYLV